MDDRSRRAYRNLALLFLLVGVAFLALAAAQALTGARLLSGNPVPVALFVLAIGGALLWTVLRAPRIEGGDDAGAAPGAEPEDAGLPGDGDDPARPDGHADGGDADDEPARLRDGGR